MQSPTHLTAKNNAAFELKGSLFTLTVLHLLSGDLNIFLAHLRRHAHKTPNLFKNMPLIIDLQRISHADDEIDFAGIQHHLRQHGLIPVGVRHGSEKQNSRAEAAGLALLSSQSAATKTKAKTEPAPTANFPANTLMITAPVRSGQQIYAKGANLIILATVSHGAEILADGHIHVYGTLRGRALAGVMGDKTARIFCQSLEAELVSVAGYYILKENLPVINAPMSQVFLVDDKIYVEGIVVKNKEIEK